MTIRAIVFDIGGILEITPPTGWVQSWETRLELPPGGLEQRLGNVWRAGSLGAISEEEVERRTGAILGLDPAQVAAFMADLWDEYLGAPNLELTAYFASLRPGYQTALLSNSFVGARHKEQERYRLGELCDLIVYSHEEGIEKPDRRIYELTCARLGLRPDEILFLDDYEPNVAAARALGMRAVLFENTTQAIADIQTCLSQG
jgi:putative hydrolase of the HAD superfamily